MPRSLGVAASGLIAALGAILALPAAAGRIEDLYRAQAVVTGQSEQNRAPGLAQSLEDVMVKVSGDPRLIGDPRIAIMAQNPDVYVRRFTYHDRLAGKPIHDEQGTYDRPHDLIVDFNRRNIDAAIRSLGREPWTKRRPRIAAFVGVRKDSRAFVVSDDSLRDADMRYALNAAAARVGLELALPNEATLAQAGLTASNLLSATLPALDDARQGGPNDAPLVGSLVWSDAAHGWIAHWRIAAADAPPFEWEVRGVGFDDAFRNGLRGAAQALSGNGQPS